MPSSSHFFIDSHMDAPASVDAALGEVVVWSSRSPDREGANEDAALVIPIAAGHAVLAVADGFGGHPNGDDASRLALEAIDASLRSRDPAQDEIRTAILDGFEMANETIRALGVGAATTLAVVEIQERWIRSYHCGDSGIIVCGGRGRVKARTVDHTPTGYAMEAGVMNEREALHHDERHIVFNMVGSAQMRIDMGPSIQLAARDTVLLASDGLFDNLTLDRIVSGIRSGPLAPSVLDLAAAAARRMAGNAPTLPSKPDDLTIVAYRARGGLQLKPQPQAE